MYSLESPHSSIVHVSHNRAMRIFTLLFFGHLYRRLAHIGGWLKYCSFSFGDSLIALIRTNLDVLFLERRVKRECRIEGIMLLRLRVKREFPYFDVLLLVFSSFYIFGRLCDVDRSFFFKSAYIWAPMVLSGVIFFIQLEKTLGDIFAEESFGKFFVFMVFFRRNHVKSRKLSLLTQKFCNSSTSEERLKTL